MGPRAPEPRDPVFLGILLAGTGSAGGWEGVCHEHVKGRGQEESGGPNDRMDGEREASAGLKPLENAEGNLFSLLQSS